MVMVSKRKAVRSCHFWCDVCFSTGKKKETSVTQFWGCDVLNTSSQFWPKELKNISGAKSTPTALCVFFQDRTDSSWPLDIHQFDCVISQTQCSHLVLTAGSALTLWLLPSRNGFQVSICKSAVDFTSAFESALPVTRFPTSFRPHLYSRQFSLG